MPFRLLPLLLALLALWGCAPQSMPAPSAVPTPTAAQALSSPSPFPAGVPMPTPALTCTPRPTPISPAGRSLSYSYTPITASYTGRDDGLFQAIYQALEANRGRELEQAISFFPQYLPPGQQAQVELQPDDYAKKDIASIFSSEYLELTQSILYDVGIAYIRLQSLSEFLLLLFRIEEDGAIMPVGIQYCFFRTWDVSFVNYCGIPFLVRTYDDIYGTGVGVEATDWLNLRTGSIPLCYSPRTLEMSSWSPMGWWDFQGALSEATIQEDDLGFTITMEATSRLYRMIDMENPQFAGTKYDWTRTDPIQIRYDAQTNTAYFLEGKGSWVDRRSGAYSFPYRIYFQPFQDQLKTAAESQDPGALWAQWVLAAGSEDGWEAVLEANGMEYEKP